MRQKFGAGYEFTRGAPWKEYNVEQQAHIVETWNEERKDRGENDELFPYIHYIIRREGQWQLSNHGVLVEVARRTATHAGW